MICSLALRLSNHSRRLNEAGLQVGMDILSPIGVRWLLNNRSAELTTKPGCPSIFLPSGLRLTTEVSREVVYEKSCLYLFGVLSGLELRPSGSDVILSGEDHDHRRGDKGRRRLRSLCAASCSVHAEIYSWQPQHHRPEYDRCGLDDRSQLCLRRGEA